MERWAAIPKCVLQTYLYIYFSNFRFLAADSSDKRSVGSTRSQDYNRVSQAIKRLGFNDESTNTIWRVLASILHLGNIDFIPKVSYFLFAIFSLRLGTFLNIFLQTRPFFNISWSHGTFCLGTRHVSLYIPGYKARFLIFSGRKGTHVSLYFPGYKARFSIFSQRQDTVLNIFLKTRHVF